MTLPLLAEDGAIDRLRNVGVGAGIVIAVILFILFAETIIDFLLHCAGKVAKFLALPAIIAAVVAYIAGANGVIMNTFLGIAVIAALLSICSLLFL